VDPENVQGLHNLCVVSVERGDLSEAEACLARAHKLAPEEGYVLRHLKIVQTRIAKMAQANEKSSSGAADADDPGGAFAGAEPLEKLHKTIPDFGRRTALADDAEPTDIRHNVRQQPAWTPEVTHSKRINRRPAGLQQQPVFVDNVPTGSTTKKVLRNSVEAGAFVDYPQNLKKTTDATDGDTPSFS